MILLGSAYPTRLHVHTSNLLHASSVLAPVLWKTFFFEYVIAWICILFYFGLIHVCSSSRVKTITPSLSPRRVHAGVKTVICFSKIRKIVKTTAALRPLHWAFSSGLATSIHISNIANSSELYTGLQEFLSADELCCYDGRFVSFILQEIMERRSLGSSKPTSTSNTTKRPELGERHYSAPSVSRRRQSDNKRNSDPTKTSERTRRSSRAGHRDDPSQSTTTSGQLQSSQQYRTSTYSSKSSVKVWIFLREWASHTDMLID